jgi:hypothetical protein
MTYYEKIHNMRGSNFELNPRAPGQWITNLSRVICALYQNTKFEDSWLKNGDKIRDARTGLMNSTEHILKRFRNESIHMKKYRSQKAIHSYIQISNRSQLPAERSFSSNNIVTKSVCSNLGLTGIINKIKLLLPKWKVNQQLFSLMNPFKISCNTEEHFLFISHCN